MDNIKTDITEVGFERGTSFSPCSKYLKGCSVRGFESQQEQETLLSSKMSRPALGPTQPPVQRVEAYFPGGKAAVA